MISKLKGINWKSRKVAAAVALTLVVALVGWVVLTYVLRDDLNDESPEQLFKLFDAPAYQRLVARLNRSNRTVLTGRLEDGLGVFLHHYLKLSEFSSVRRRSLDKGSLEFDINPTAGAFAQFIDRHITSRLMASGGGDLWILDNGRHDLSRIDAAVVQRLLERHPNDKFIIVNEPTYQQVRTFELTQLDGFRVLNFHRPAERAVLDVLNTVGIDSKLHQKLLMRYSQGSLHQLSKLLAGESPKDDFTALFQDQIETIKEASESLGSKSSALTGLLKQLCESG